MTEHTLSNNRRIACFLCTSVVARDLRALPVSVFTGGPAGVPEVLHTKQSAPWPRDPVPEQRLMHQEVTCSIPRQGRARVVGSILSGVGGGGCRKQLVDISLSYGCFTLISMFLPFSSSLF